MVVVLNSRVLEDSRFISMYIFQTALSCFLVLKLSREVICPYSAKIETAIASSSVWMSFGLVFSVYTGSIIKDTIFFFLVGLVGLLATNFCKELDPDIKLLEKDIYFEDDPKKALIRLEKLSLFIERASKDYKRESKILRGFIDEH